MLNSLAVALAVCTLALAQAQTSENEAKKQEPGSPAAQVNRDGEQAGTSGASAGRALRKESAEFGKEIAKGDVKRAGAAMGKGAVQFGKGLGTGVGKGAANIGKGVGAGGKKAGETMIGTDDK